MAAVEGATAGSGAAAFLEGMATVGNAAYNIYSKERARTDALEAQIHNEKLLREAWARDDTAKQRMVKDLEAAGLSKWLAAGASPMSSSPISLQSPSDTAVDTGIADTLSHSYQNMLQAEQTREQTETMQKQREAVDKSIEVQEAEKQIKEQELRMKKHDADVLDSRTDVMSNDPTTLKYIAEGLKLLKGKTGYGLPGVGDIPAMIQREKDRRSAEREKKRNEKRHNDYVQKKESVNEAKQKDKGNDWKPLSYVDWLRMNQLPANSGTIQSYRSYAERR